MSNCQQCEVSSRSVCGVLSDDERALLARHGKIQTLKRGQALMWEGEDALLVANVLEGALTLSTATSDGREQIVGVAFPADFIGRPFEQRSGHTVTALMDSRVCLFPRSALDNFARDHPAMGADLLRRAIDELDRARRWMLLLGRMTARERIATFLLHLSKLPPDGIPDPSTADRAPRDRFTLSVDRQQIGDVLGLTIETVSRQLSQLKAAGIIGLPDRRSVEILNRGALTDMAGS